MTIRITLDARYDLWAGDFANDDEQCEQFEIAYLAAAEAYGEEIGQKIEVTFDRGSTNTGRARAATDEEAEAWQAIHDRVKWHAPRVPDDDAPEMGSEDFARGVIRHNVAGK